MSKTIIEAPRAPDRFMIWPEEVVLIGLDTDHKRGEHELWDSRVFRGYNEASVRNLMVHRATLLPAIVVEISPDGQKLTADGRGRVLDSREANRRLREQGLEPFRIEAKVKRKVDAETSFAKMVVGNAFATAPTLMEQARKAYDMIHAGIPMERVTLNFGRTEVTIKHWCELAELPDEFAKRIESGHLSATQALKLARSSKEQQDAVLRTADARAEKAKADKAKRPSARDIDKASGKTLPPSRKELKATVKRLAETANDVPSQIALRVLEWAYKGGDLSEIVSALRASHTTETPVDTEPETDEIVNPFDDGTALEKALLEHVLSPTRGTTVPNAHKEVVKFGIPVDMEDVSKCLRDMLKRGLVAKPGPTGYKLPRLA